ncbi:MAG: adenylate/guanylate cyclase domain-containing protein [Alphaproteobacteria bacterium]|nr:adenylate/guanylate cyclase domain-containing protein [Alphaproteobacteria bacterium]
MKLTRRARRDWLIFLWISIASAAVSAYFGYSIRLPGGSQLWGALNGIAISLCIATPIVLFELKKDRLPALRRITRLPLALYFTVRLAFYLAVIAIGLLGVGALFSLIESQAEGAFARLRESFVFAAAMSIVGNLFFEVGGLLGFGTLRDLLTGRYVQPRKEQRVFALIDLKDSTGLAERLGPIRFHELLNAFFQDVALAALECEAEIHKYVGDEAILTWPISALADSRCLECPFQVLDAVEARRADYLARFGAMPSFRAALHCGEIVAGEIGDVRREIAFVGDTLNVAARLLEAAKDVRRDMLASEDLLAAAEHPAWLRVEALPVLNVRGRAAPLGIAALSRA